MSKTENPRRFQILEGPTVLSMGEAGLSLRQGDAALAFSSIEDFMEFVNRIGILAVRLDQQIQLDNILDKPPGDDQGTPV